MDRFISEILRLSFYRYVLTIPLGIFSLFILVINLKIFMCLIDSNTCKILIIMDTIKAATLFFKENLLFISIFSILLGELLALTGELRLFSIFRKIEEKECEIIANEKSKFAIYKIKSLIYPRLQKNSKGNEQEEEEFICVKDLVKFLGINTLREQSEMMYSLSRVFAGLAFSFKFNVFTTFFLVFFLLMRVIDNSVNINLLIVGLFSAMFTVILASVYLLLLLKIEDITIVYIKDFFIKPENSLALLKRIYFMFLTVSLYGPLILLFSEMKLNIAAISIIVASFIILYTSLYFLMLIASVILKSMANQINLLIIHSETDEKLKNSTPPQTQ